MAQPRITQESVSGEALFILRTIKENGRLGRSNKLADVKTTLDENVSLDFDSYFFFLRKFHYIAMDREAQLRLTDSGERVVEGSELEKFTGEVGDFFVEHFVPAEERTMSGMMAPTRGGEDGPPPPPMEAAESREENISLSDVNVDVIPPPPPHAGEITQPPGPAPLLPPSSAFAHPPAPGTSIPLSSASPAAPAKKGGRTPILPQAAQEEPFIPNLSNTSSPSPSAMAPSSSSNPPASSASSSSAAASSKDGGAKGTEIDTRYVKFDPIGSGPLGTVFKGRHNALGLDVSIKELKDIFGYFSFLQRGEVIKRLKRELCAQAQVRHPGIVGVLDQNTDVARPYFVMELCKGNLREKLDAANGKGIDVPLALRYFLQMVYALRSAHAQGLTHHNVKPENVLFDTYGNAKIGDFGLSRVIEVDASKGMPQVFVGTGGMGYMSPELIARSKDVGQSADVYALGIMLYEMLTGQIPGRRSPMPSEVRTEIPAKLDPVFDKMTQDRKEARYPDFDAMMDDFYAAFGESEFLKRGDLILWSNPASAPPL